MYATTSGDAGAEPLGASAEAIQHHYDLSNDFYRLWLDPTMTYSCALWEGEEQSLEDAQRGKMQWIAEFLDRHECRNVLDIGCGWGATLRHLTSAWQERRATGLTLSAAQHRYVADQAWDRVSVRLEGWETHRPERPYDGIVSVGAFEHFATLDLSPRERVERYRSFFASSRDLLSAGGPMVVQTIAYGAASHTRSGNEFFATIFPESDCPRLEEMVEASEGLFELVSLRNDRLHYVRTLKCWLRNLRANRSAATSLVGEDVYETYRRYLALSAIAFQTNSHVLLRTQWLRL